MAVYHITYAPEVKELYLYLDAGCPMRCWGCITEFYPLDCHMASPGGAPRGPLPVEEALRAVEPLEVKKALFLGREPTVDPDLPRLLKALKARGVHNVLITNGWRVLTEGVDEVCLSIKAVTPRVFQAFTGLEDPRRVLENFRRYASTGVLLRAESVLVPGLVEQPEIGRIARFIAGVNPSIPYRIDAYLPHPGDSYRAPTLRELQEARERARRYLKEVTILHSGVRQLWSVERIY
ncbi:MAG: hypothetical protein DRG55_08195 [Deltaproteobacteria bacterium]|nr:MAG: hypothetical protein DRG55_08195 [Deltaproteobacteria bacterium]